MVEFISEVLENSGDVHLYFSVLVGLILSIAVFVRIFIMFFDLFDNVGFGIALGLMAGSINATIAFIFFASVWPVLLLWIAISGPDAISRISAVYEGAKKIR